MAKVHSTDIAGFHLGAIVPLERVGHVLAEIYKSNGGDLKIAPFFQEAPSKRSRLADTNGIAGLLAPPPAARQPTDFRAFLLRALHEAGSAGLPRKELMQRAVDAGYSAKNGLIYQLVAKGEIKSLGSAQYAIGSKAPAVSELAAIPEMPAATVGPAKTGPATITQVILEFLSTVDRSSGCARAAIWDAVQSHGFAAQGFPSPVLKQLVDSKQVRKLGRGRYALADGGADRANGHKSKR